MILKLIIDTPLENGLFEKIAIRVAEDLSIKVGLSRKENFLEIYIDGDEKEIETFSNVLSEELPISIFLNEVKAEVVENFVDDLERIFPDISLPPCPKCLREVKDEKNENYFNIFHHCEVCGYKASGEKTIKEDFEKLVEKLKNGENILIQTMNGKFEVTTSVDNVDLLVARNLGVIANNFMSFEGDDKALGSIEKPMMKLKSNINFKKDFDTFNSAYFVKLPDCMVLELLFEISDFRVLGLKKSDKTDDLSFDVDNPYEVPKVVVSERKALLYSGDRGVLPKFEKYIDIGIASKNRDYYSYSDSDIKRVVVDKKNPQKEFKEVKEVFGGFFGVKEQYNLSDKVTMGFSFYKDGESQVFLNSPKFGLVDLIKFDFKFESFEEIFASISIMDENGKKLVENFKKSPLFDKAINKTISSDKVGIYYLWGVVGMLLDFADNVEDGAEELLRYANDAITKKGPRIDYKLDENNLNPLWVVRTAMSFHLAGVDNFLISYGVIESFAEFLSNHYENFNRDTDLDGAIIVGNLFEGEFLSKIYGYISKNYPVFIPKALPITGAIESYGGLVIQKEIV